VSAQGRRDGIILKIVSFLDNYIGNDTGNVVISNVDALVYVVLSRAETHVPYGELVGAKECITL
jgi:hypothetical protein